MGKFELSADVDANKIFLVNHSELEGRLDIDYYRPAISLLEKKVREKSAKKLKDFIVKIASGATPSVQEETKFYGDEESGIPFLRVQNLNENGELSLDDVKFINQKTHDNYLKRSQVSEYDLLVKITGVGRMAIASVAPTGFVGNTNQHMVIIKTTSEEQSHYLSNYLNLDIVEALASRRATGATRPALDYPALKSIPVIENIDFSALKKAELLKQKKETQAQALLDSIDAYLLTELGITLPEQDSRLEKRMFTVPLSEVTGSRLDPDMALYRRHTKTSKFPLSKLSNHLLSPPQYGANERGVERLSKKIPRYVRITDISEFGELSEGLGVAAEVADDKYLLVPGDLLFARSGNTVGKAYLHIGNDEEQHVFAGYMIRFRLNPATLLPAYVLAYTLCQAYKEWRAAVQRAAGQPNINAEEYKALLIPLPPIEKQNEIAAHISDIRAQAKQLQEEAAQILATAKAEIERMILGEAA